PLGHRRMEDRRAVDHVFRGHAAAARGAAYLPVVGRAAAAGRLGEEVVEEERLVLRTGEEILRRRGVEDLGEAIEGRAAVAYHGERCDERGRMYQNPATGGRKIAAFTFAFGERFGETP